MAPDLNTVPDSPHQQRPRTSQPSSNHNSRRPSQIGQSFGTSPSMPHSPVFAHPDPNAMPMRHPRPMTAAELHTELEKEQEAIVNRLTRELSVLRAQNSASVVSNTSASSASVAVDPADPNPTHQMTGPTHPTASRRHRSSSNLSAVSARAQTATSSGTSAAHAASVPPPGRSQASADRAAAATGTSLSRNPSVSTSGASTPARHAEPASGNLVLPHRPSLSQAASFTSQNTSSTHATLGSTTSPHPLPQHGVTSVPTSYPLQYGIDADRARNELEAVKTENEALKDRIRALERTLRQRQRRESNTSDISSVSGLTPAASTTIRSPTVIPAPLTGVNLSAWAAGADGVSPEETTSTVLTSSEDRDDVIKVGESAGNSGLH